MLKKIIFTILLCLTFVQYSNAKPASGSSVEKLINITNSEAEFKKSIELEEQSTYELIENIISEQKDKITPKQLDAINHLNKDIGDFFKNFYSWEKIKPEIIIAYTQVYTQDEIDAMLKFYESSIGKSILSKSPQLTDKKTEVMAKQMKEIGPALNNILSNAIQNAQ